MGLRHGEPRSVRWYRLNAGLTGDELARLAHIAPNTLRRMERGYRASALGHEAERRVADALGVTVEAIAFGSAEDPAEPVVDLAAEREARMLMIGEVAEQANVPLRTVARAEAGVAVAPRYARRLADFYGVKVTSFYPRERRAAAA